MKILITFVGIQCSSECLLAHLSLFGIALQFLPTRGRQDIVCVRWTVYSEFRMKTFLFFLSVLYCSMNKIFILRSSCLAHIDNCSTFCDSNFDFENYFVLNT